MNTNRTPWIVLGGLVLVALVLVLASLFSPEKTQTSTTLNVVTTFFPLQDWTARIVGDAGTVTPLFPNGTGPHDASFTPESARALNSASVLVMNGLGVESAINVTELHANQPSLKIIQTGDAVPNLIQANGTINPHVWLSPKQAMVQVDAIVAGLSEADPKDASTFHSNGDALLADLTSLDQNFTSAIQPLTNKKFIAFHSAMPYVARDYGLVQVATIEEFPGKDPTPQELKDIRDLIKAEDVRVIFTEPQFSPRIAQSIAQDTGVQLAVFDTLETGDPVRDTYVSKMRANLENLRQAMR